MPHKSFAFLFLKWSKIVSHDVHWNAIVAPAFSWSSAVWAWLAAGVASAANQSGGAGDNSERGIQQRMFQCDCVFPCGEHILSLTDAADRRHGGTFT